MVLVLLVVLVLLLAACVAGSVWSATSFEKRLRKDVPLIEARRRAEAALLVEVAKENDRRWYSAGGSR
jgi:hypothetical protein